MDFAPYSSDNNSDDNSDNDSAALAYRRPATRSKTRITIYLDDDVLVHFRALAKRDGTGYQTLINGALRSRLSEASGGCGWSVITAAKCDWNTTASLLSGGPGSAC